MKTLVLPRPKSQVTLTITMQNPYEDLQGTPTLLPDAEPEVAQVAWTVASGDLPTFNIALKSQVYVGILIAGGRNTNTSTRTIYYRMKKNGGSVKTSSFTCAASYYWTLQTFFHDIAVGDLLEISLWASVADVVDWDYTAYQVHPTRVEPYVLVGEVLKPLNFATVTAYPTLTLGAPTVFTTNSLIFYLGNSTQTTAIGATVSLAFETIQSTYKLFQLYGGDFLYSNIAASATAVASRPRYYQNRIPVSIIYRNYGEIT